MKAMPEWHPTFGTALIRSQLRQLDQAESRAFRAFASGNSEQRVEATKVLKRIISTKRELIGAN